MSERRAAGMRWASRMGRRLVAWGTGRGGLATALAVMFLVLSVGVWRGPWWLDDKWLDRRGPVLTAPEATLITGLRTALVQVLIALGATVALWFTWRNYQLTRRGQVTDRFIKALERLGSEELYVRYGGILALEQIVQDAPDQAAHAAQVLGAFIRSRAPERQQDPAPSTEDPGLATPKPKRPAEDVQAALTALTRPASRRFPHDQRIDLGGLDLADVRLNGADLSGALLGGADLSGAMLVQANLSGANLGGTDLSGAMLDAANLSSAQLRRANLSGALLGGADLSGAKIHRADLSNALLDVADLSNARLDRSDLSDAVLYQADLSGAHLDGADLSGTALGKADLASAKGLTVAQLVAARPDATTRLPTELATDPAVAARIAEVTAEHTEIAKIAKIAELDTGAQITRGSAVNDSGESVDDAELDAPAEE